VTLETPPFRYEVRVCWSEEDGVYLAEVSDLPGCVTHGSTPALAFAAAEEPAAAWLDVARARGWPIPEPTRRHVA
jgi:predicted RNase H-like HicB family nuclease